MSLALERCAEMRAEMDAGRLRDDVLAQAGVSADEWTEAQRGWLDKMGAELELGRFELTNRYTQAFLARQRELAVAAPKPVAPPPALAPPAAAPVPPAPAAVLPAMGGVAPPPMAMAMAEAAPRPAGAPSPWATDPTLATPFDGASAPESLPPTTLESSDITFQPGPSPLRAALPFQASGPGAVPAAPPSAPATSAAAPPAAPRAPGPVPPAKKPDLMKTMGVGSISPFAAVLPFAAPPAGGAEGPKPAQPPPAAPAVDPARPAPKPAPPELGSTVMGTISPFASSLPFTPSPAVPPPANRSTTAATPFVAPRPEAPRPAPAAPVEAPPPAAPPAAPPADAPPTAPLTIGGLTLEQHASLCAEMANAPTRVAEVLARYRVSAEAKAEMDAGWKARFPTAPELLLKWNEAYRLYFAFLQSARRG